MLFSFDPQPTRWDPDPSGSTYLPARRGLCGMCVQSPPAFELIAPPNVKGLPASEFEGRHILRRAAYGESGHTVTLPLGGTFDHDPFATRCHWRTHARVWQNVVHPDDHILRASPPGEYVESTTDTDPIWTIAWIPSAWVVCAGALTDIGHQTDRNFWCTGLSNYADIADLSDWPVDALALDIPALFKAFRCGFENVFTRTHDDPAHPMSGVSQITVRPCYK